MSNSIIENLDSERVFYFFEEISKIPRGSGNEKQISDYIVEFAEKRNLEVIQDSVLNVIIKKPGSKGYENSETIIIQGHLDMVCEKNISTVHDFEKDPIKVIYEEDFMRADGTTLGADNGIAVAMGLALLDSENIEHPPLEIVFTTDEEVGMGGAEKLDGNNLTGKVLINVDSEDEGVFTAGCAGGMKTLSEIPVELESQKDNFDSYLLILNGLKGGHSGVDITKQRANSNILLARTLNKLLQSFEIKVSEIKGGAKDNAIPREAEAVISFDKKDFSDISDLILEIQENFKSEYRNTDKNIKISIIDSKKADKNFTDESIKRVVSTMILIPNGVQTMSTDIEGLPESSNNLGVVNTIDNNVIISCAVRSSVISKKYYIYEQIKSLTELANGKASYKGDYPAWEFNPESNIRKIFLETYKKMYNEDAVINTIHAGLECGLFGKKIKNADIISFGPNLYDVHTPDEKASISSIERTWKFFKEILKNLK